MTLGSELDPILDGIASERVAPAGGSAAAMVGAIAASLAEMAAIHTLRGEPGNDRTQLAAGRRTLNDVRALLVGLADADARIVDAAFGGSSSDLTPPTAQKLVGVPLATAEACQEVRAESQALVSIVSPSVIQDLRTAITLVTGALRASLETALANLDLVEGATRDRLAERVADVAGSKSSTA
jgi:formiminotetrahydrofolate cyclodeaminase